MTHPIYEPIDEALDRPATKADVGRILRAIEILYEQINQQNRD